MGGCGKSEIKRAIVLGAGGIAASEGKDESNEVNRAVASWAGILVSVAASCHGSKSRRASADSMLSNIPFLSSPTGAKRKGSNSDLRPNAEAADVIGRASFPQLVLAFNQTADAAKGLAAI
jgi:hypothetical protein